MPSIYRHAVRTRKSIEEGKKGGCKKEEVTKQRCNTWSTQEQVAIRRTGQNLTCANWSVEAEHCVSKEKTRSVQGMRCQVHHTWTL